MESTNNDCACSPIQETSSALGCFEFGLMPCTCACNGNNGGNNPGNGGKLPIIDIDFDKEVSMGHTFRGKEVFGKLIDFGELPNKSVKKVAHGIEGISWCQLDEKFSYITKNASTGIYSVDFTHRTDPANNWEVSVTSSDVVVATASDKTEFKMVAFVIYTKK